MVSGSKVRTRAVIGSWSSLELSVLFSTSNRVPRRRLAWGSKMPLSASSASDGGCEKCMCMSPEVLRLLVSGANEEPSLCHLHHQKEDAVDFKKPLVP